MANFPTYGGPGEGASHFGGGGLGTPAPAVGPKVVSFTQQRPGGAMTLDALMARQKDAAARQAEALATPQTTIPGGIGQMLTSFVQGFRGSRAEQEEQRGHQVISDVFSKIDPVTGATAEQMAAIGPNDPDMMIKLWSDRATRRADLAKQEHWVDIPNPPGTKEGVQWQQNTLNGEKRAAGSSAGVSIQNEPALQDWQAKDMGYWGQGTRSNDLLNEDDLDYELGGKPMVLWNQLPDAISKWGMTEAQQRANNAGLSFLAAILRKESGAAITKEDIDTSGRIYLPQPGESRAVWEQKRQLRENKMREISAGVEGRPEFEPIKKNIEQERATRAEQKKALNTPLPMPDADADYVKNQVYTDETGQKARYLAVNPNNVNDPANWKPILGAPAAAGGK
jgi:hypothetical protein